MSAIKKATQRAANDRQSLCFMNIFLHIRGDLSRLKYKFWCLSIFGDMLRSNIPLGLKAFQVQMKLGIFIIVLMVVICSSAVSRAAATFCVETNNMAPQCFYYDAEQCQKAANAAGGVCTHNSQEGAVGFGNSVYCKVRSDRVSECIYDDYSSCTASAAKDKSICVRNSRKAKPPQPFKYQNGVYN